MKRLASALLFIHMADHVHKSIRADNVILFASSDDTDDDSAASSSSGGSTKSGSSSSSSSAKSKIIGTPFLLGFDLVRKDAQATEWSKTTDTHKYYYLPPDRQGDPQRKYSMLDDVYSLGVLFLEIALCLSFVKPIPPRLSPLSPPDSQEKETTISWRRHPILLEEQSHSHSKTSTRPIPVPLQPEPLRRRLIAQAKKSAARTMGSTIAGLIVSCLSCLHDPDAFGSREALQDQDGILMGIAYVKQVLSVLDQVSL